MARTSALTYGILRSFMGFDQPSWWNGGVKTS